MKHFYLLFAMLWAVTSWAQETTPTEEDDDCHGYYDEKGICHNYSIPHLPYCEECSQKSFAYNYVDNGVCIASYIDTMTYNYIHMGIDFQIEKTNPGCSACSGGSATNSLQTLLLKRYHKFRNMSDRGSFGPGIFSNYDKYLTIYEVNGKTQIDVFFAEDLNARRYFQQGNAFYDTFARTHERLELYDSEGNVTTVKADAKKARIWDFDQTYYDFDLFDIDTETTGGRLTGHIDRNGYGTRLTYKVVDPATDVDPSTKWQINVVTDANNRTLTFDYLSSTRSGMWVVSKVTLPNTSFISYVYGPDVDSVLSKVIYPDGTESTFTSVPETASVTKVSIFEAGEKGSHRNKHAYVDNNFVAGSKGREKIEYFNSASLLINAVEKGDELAFQIFQKPVANHRRIYFDNKVKEVDIIRNRFMDNWYRDETATGYESLKGNLESKHERGDWKFYSGNAQSKMPIKWEEDGLKYSYLYNYRKAPIKKIYPDATFEAWEYNEFNQVTRYRDRIGRVTRYTYDSRGNMLSKTVGLMAQPNGTAGTEIPGLLCQVYDWTGNNLPTNWGSMIPVETVSIPNLQIDFTDREERYAMLYTGDITIDQAGDYTFFLSSDDGSKLFIDGVEVINNDGAHGLKEVASAAMNLSASKHSIRVEFFERSGAQQLFLKYQGLDTAGEKVDVPESAYTHHTVEAELAETDKTTLETATYSSTYYPATAPANKFLKKTDTDANGNTTTYIYDTDNQLLRIIEPDDAGTGTHAKSIFTYDAYKRFKTSEDAVGRVSEFFYDDRDRVIRIEYNDDSTEVFKYGTGADANLLVKQKDRNGNTTKFLYDALGRAHTTISAYSIMNEMGTSETVNPVSMQSIRVCTFIPGTDIRETCTVNGELTKYYYDYRNRLVATHKFTDANSELISSSQYKDNKLFKRTDAYGRRTYFNYRFESDSALIRTIKETKIGTLNLTSFNAVKNKTRATDNNANYLITDYILDDEGQQTAVVDPRGIRHETYYDSRGRTTFRIQAAETLAQTTQTIYDANSNVLETRSPRWFTGIDDATRMAYTNRNLLKSRTVGYGSPVAVTESFTYYDDGRAHTHTDFRNKVTTSVWHQCCGRFQASIDQDKNIQVSNNDFYGNVTHTAVVDKAAGTITDYHDLPNTETVQEVTTKFDSRHRPVARTVWLDALDDVDPNNPPIFGESGAPAGKTGLTTFYLYYDEIDHPELAPLKAELLDDGISFGAENDGSAVITVNPEGEAAVSIMDGAGRTVAQGMYDKTDFADGTYTLVTWSSVVHDNVVDGYLETKSVSALNHTNKVHSDGAGRTIKSIDSEGFASTFEYDDNSNLLKSRDANNIGQDCVFDDLNRDISCTDTENSTTSRVFDLNNNVTKSVDAKGKLSLAAYDERNRTTNSWNRLVTEGYDIDNLPPENTSTRYDYDDNSNVLFITDAIGKITGYEYDDRNLLVKTTYADSGVVECSYDALRRKSVSTDQLGDTVNYLYDLASRLEYREYRNGGTTLESTDSFTYDDASRVLTAVKGRYSNTVTFTFDGIGRRETETTTIGTDSYTVTHAYDDDNREINCYYPAGTNVVKGWTDRNQLGTVSFGTDNIITSLYDDGGREETRTFGNGLVNTMTYNDDNTRKASAVGGKADLSFSYTHDENKNVVSETSIGSVMSDYSWDTAKEDASSGFDANDRVTNWQRSNGDKQAWDLDLIGNWGNTTGSVDGNDFDENREHNDVHELTDMGGNTVQYDDKGNMTNDAWLNSSSWDIDNHLQSHNAVTFTYDALGRRLEKKTSTVNTLFISSGQRVVEEYADSGSGYQLARTYAFGSYIDDVIAKVEGGNTLYYHSDRQYNARGLSNDSGAVEELYAYSVYGKQIIMDAAGTVQVGSAVNNFYGYTGRYIDSETGLWYFRARYFDAEMGRFINRDPLGYVDGMSLYNGYFAEGFALDPMGTAEMDKLSDQGKVFNNSSPSTPTHTPRRSVINPPNYRPYHPTADDKNDASGRDCTKFNCGGFSFQDYRWYSKKDAENKLKNCKKIDCSQECECNERKCWYWTWTFRVYAYFPKPIGKQLVQENKPDYHIVCHDQDAAKKYAKTAKGPIREINHPRDDRPNASNPANHQDVTLKNGQVLKNIKIQAFRENLTETCYCCPKYQSPYKK